MTAVKPASDVKNVTATRTATKTATATAPERVFGLKSASQRKFRNVCHHCGLLGHIRPRYFKLLREKNQMEQAYGMRSAQGVNHGGFELRNTWSRIFDHYGDGGMGFPTDFGGYESSY
ncbi:hypothetical protein DY000_02020506 [Brassica cretica]|uniref:Zinc knuckle CX2CX4HX4C domain-containing protein n=1 Tax=Brassica cretica TaxID=69181 RepID=A0ABQ7E899_BRACR|nr:hypothetical protein DY000_02020506 [Brassica cretica]